MMGWRGGARWQRVGGPPGGGRWVCPDLSGRWVGRLLGRALYLGVTIRFIQGSKCSLCGAAGCQVNCHSRRVPHVQSTRCGSRRDLTSAPCPLPRLAAMRQTDANYAETTARDMAKD